MIAELRGFETGTAISRVVARDRADGEAGKEGQADGSTLLGDLSTRN